MRKDNIRDYATEAFRYYASCGRKTSEELMRQLKDQIYEQSRKECLRSGNMPTDATAYAVMEAEEAVLDMQAEILDIMAVERTLLQLTKHQRMAVEIVYFANPEKDIAKGEISERVHKAEIEIPASTDSIYRWLRIARGKFAKERGLRMEKQKKKRKLIVVEGKSVV